MDTILTDLSAEALTDAIERNSVAFPLAMGRAGGGEELVEDGLHWVIGGSPIAYHNCVVRAELAPEQADAAIERSIAAFRARGVPGSWHLGPSARPADLGARLAAHGFTPGDEPGMAADLLALSEPAPPPGLAIERVRDAATLDAWADVLAEGFGEGEREATWVRAMWERLGYADVGPWRHYLGRLGGRPVATATLFLAAGVAGLYFISTAPPERGRGIGAAITLAPLREARALGYRAGVLGASPMGEPVYRRLGFRTYCTLGVYEWQEAAG